MKAKPFLAGALRERVEIESGHEPSFPFPHPGRKFIAEVPDEIDIARQLTQELRVSVFQSEVEYTGSLLHVPIRLFLRIGTLSICLKKSAYFRFSVDTRLSLA